MDVHIVCVQLLFLFLYVDIELSNSSKVVFFLMVLMFVFVTLLCFFLYLICNRMQHTLLQVSMTLFQKNKKQKQQQQHRTALKWWMDIWPNWLYKVKMMHSFSLVWTWFWLWRRWSRQPSATITAQVKSWHTRGSCIKRLLRGSSWSVASSLRATRGDSCSAWEGEVLSLAACLFSGPVAFA